MAPAQAVRPSSPTAPLRAPPTGPKALRGPATDGSGPPLGLSPKADKALGSFPQSANAVAGPSTLNAATAAALGNYGYGAAVRPGRNFRPHANGYRHVPPHVQSQQQYLQEQFQQQLYQQPYYAQGYAVPVAPSGPRANHAPPAGPSSQYLQYSAAPAIPPPPPPADPPPPPDRPSPPHSSSSRQAAPRSPKGSTSRSRQSSGVNEAAAGSSYKSKFLPTDEAARTPISFSIPTLPNGKARPRPPHLDAADKTAGNEQSASRSKQPPPPPAKDPPTPPPPPDDDQPPPPDFDDIRPPPSPPDTPPAPPSPTSIPVNPPPPPELLGIPPPPPSPRLPTPPPPDEPESDPPDTPPPPPLHDEPPSPPPPPPLRSARESPIPPPARQLPSHLLRVETPPLGAESSNRPVQRPPPAFHFRDLAAPQRRDEASDSGDDAEDATDSDDEELPPPPRRMLNRSPPPHLARPAPPPLPPKSPTPPPPDLGPPACVFEREAGSFMVTLGPDGKKEISRRWDGRVNGQAISVTDPRVDKHGQRKSSAREEPLFRGLNYDWDQYSVGKKPLPPPTAILITGLNPLTTLEQIRAFLRPHGKVREIDCKMDTRSGMQLGICWVKFEGPSSAQKAAGGKALTPHEVAVKAVKACDGQGVGLHTANKIKVVLDGRGLRADQAVKEEMARRYPPKSKPAASASTKAATPMAPPASDPASGHATPLNPAVSAAGASSTVGTGERVLPIPVPVKFRGTAFRPPPRPANPLLTNPRPPTSAFQTGLSRFGPTLPFRPPGTTTSIPGLPVRPAPATQQLASSFTDSPFERRGRDRSPQRGRQYSRYARGYSRSRSSSGSHSSSCSTCSDSDDDRPPYRRREGSPRRPDRAGAKLRTEDDEETKKALVANGRPALFIASSLLAVTVANEKYLKIHFKRFKPEKILPAPTGYYILFTDHTSARDAMFLDGSLIGGKKLSLSIKTDHMQTDAGAAAAAVSQVAARTGKGWQMMTIGKKNKALTPAAAAPSPKPSQLPRKKRILDDSDSEDVDEVSVKAPVSRNRSPSQSSASDLSEEELAAKPASKQSRGSLASGDEVSNAVPVVSTPSATPAPAEEGESEQEVEDKEEEVVIQTGKKRPAPKVKAPKKGKKARIVSPAPLVEAPLPPEPLIAEIKLDIPPPGVPAATKPTSKPKAKPKKAPAGPLEKLVSDGAIQDEEDAYWLSQALSAMEDGDEPTFSDDEDEWVDLLPEEHPLYHTSGAWRAQGLRKVPHALKSSYLPQRNRAQAAAETAASSAAGHGLTTGRTARVTGRRLANDMETHRKITSTTAESDLFAFNQLRIRKKQLRFARSAIEGYGLYAMETIQVGEMVCEYVGELIRSAIADLREARYLKQGIGSSYLFRIDGDVVCDATFRGSVSRLINHSCDPSASAKIISINGQSKIVIYAKRLLSPGEEILYDYKFPLESDPALRVPCLCGSKICRGFLN